MEVVGSGKMVFVGKYPASEEVRQGKPFVGESGKLLRDLINSFGIRDYALTNAVRCPVTDDRYDDFFKLCSPMVVNEILALEPEVVILLGVEASKLKKFFRDIKVIEAPHPLRAKLDPQALDELKSKIATALSVKKIARLPDFKVVSDPSAFIPLILHAPFVVVDLEVTGGYDPKGKPLVAGLALGDPNKVLIVPLSDRHVAKVLAQTVLSHRCWVAHNTIYELVWLSRLAGLPIQVTKQVNFADTLLMQYVLDEALSDYSLKSLCKRYFGEPDWGEWVKDYMKTDSLDKCPTDLLYRYCAKDAQMTAYLYLTLDRTLAKPTHTYARRILKELLYPAVTLYARAIDVGIKIDLDSLTELGRQIEENLNYLLRKLENYAKGINPNSPSQIADFLKRQGVSPISVTAKGQFSTRESDLIAIMSTTDKPAVRDFIKTLLEYRELAKIYNTYIVGLKQWVNSDGRVRPSWKLHGTVSGRITCINPPLQTIPAHSDYADSIRKIFVADDGRVFLDADFSNHELRVAINLARDHDAARIFNEGRDFHKEVAAKIFKVPYDQVTDQMRQTAKRVNFGLLYGMSTFSLANHLGLKEDEAQQILDDYAKAFPAVWRWRQQIVAKARVCGYVEVNETGRRRHLPHIKSPDPSLRARAEREAINTPVQSFASDLCLLTALNFSYDADPNWVVLLTIHDSLLIQVPFGDVSVATERLNAVVDGLTKQFRFIVPIKLDVAVKQRWAKGETENGDMVFNQDEIA